MTIYLPAVSSELYLESWLDASVAAFGYQAEHPTRIGTFYKDGETRAKRNRDCTQFGATRTTRLDSKEGWFDFLEKSHETRDDDDDDDEDDDDGDDDG